MRENPYKGVNAHLNSLLQTPGEEEQPGMWTSFHGRFIGYIADGLNAVLPENYIAFSEQSLQTREIEPDILDLMKRYEEPRPDVTVFRTARLTETEASANPAAPTWEVPLVIEDIELPRAVVIREVMPNRKIGRIVSRIELLSPSNKPRKSNFLAYLMRRQESLEGGVPLTEIDLLHETLPIVKTMPVYPRDPDSFPYSIIVSDPRPDWEHAKVRGYSFSVDEPFKPFTLPLAGTDEITFDLTTIYQQLFAAGRWSYVVEYDQLPDRFEIYSTADQERIRAVMARVAEGS